MKKEKNNNIYYIILTVFAFCVFFFKITQNGVVYNNSSWFVYERLVSMKDMLSSGKLPFIYYNHFYSHGYGTPFFYGQLTLYPFLFFVGHEKLFCIVFTVFTDIFAYFSFVFLAKRFTKNYWFYGVLWLFTDATIAIAFRCAQQISFYAYGFLFLFIAYLIDMLRNKNDYSSCCLASVMYFLLFNTHLQTALVGFVVAAFLVILYFDKEHIKMYACLFLTTTVLCSYMLANMIYHIDSLAVYGEPWLHFHNYANIWGIIGQVLRGYNLPNSICNLLWLMLTVVTLIVARREFFSSKKNIACLVVLIVSWLVMQESLIWYKKEYYDIFKYLQHPMRYMSILAAFAIILIARYIRPKDIYMWLMIGVVNLIIVACISNPIAAYFGEVYRHIGIGEYYTDCAVNGPNKPMINPVFGINYTDLGANLTNYHTFSTVDVTVGDEDGSVDLGVAKIWYKGYMCKDQYGRYYDVVKGDNAMCVIKDIHVEHSVSDTKSEYQLTLWYNHPWWLCVMDFATIILSVALFVFGYHRKILSVFEYYKEICGWNRKD